MIGLKSHYSWTSLGSSFYLDGLAMLQSGSYSVDTPIAARPRFNGSIKRKLAAKLPLTRMTTLDLLYFLETVRYHCPLDNSSDVSFRFYKLLLVGTRICANETSSTFKQFGMCTKVLSLEQAIYVCTKLPTPCSYFSR